MHCTASPCLMKRSICVRLGEFVCKVRKTTAAHKLNLFFSPSTVSDSLEDVADLHGGRKTNREKNDCMLYWQAVSERLSSIKEKTALFSPCGAKKFGISQPGSLKRKSEPQRPAKRNIYQLKVMKVEEPSAFFPPANKGTITVNSLNYGNCSGDLQVFLLSPTMTDCVLALSR
ncbi:hypothetical protein CEXT_606191 [Caerostris extrusa]|uniref:Uncharacterized protein n=1 Tax=Caerostris extrusa TaxID=172846 RepID=A0AAV4V1Y2_CAEEX|nr:hypothetical protein CEXT_606191 [Caerostris extrusa]